MGRTDREVLQVDCALEAVYGVERVLHVAMSELVIGYIHIEDPAGCEI